MNPDRKLFTLHARSLVIPGSILLVLFLVLGPDVPFATLAFAVAACLVVWGSVELAGRLRRHR